MKKFSEFLAEGELASSDIKISASGQKIRAHHFKVGDVARVRHALEKQSAINLRSTDEVLKDIKKQFKRIHRGKDTKSSQPAPRLIDPNVVTEDIPFYKDPPMTLVIRRTAIRLYPDHTKIALYYSPQLKKYFTVPYGHPMDSVIQAQDE